MIFETAKPPAQVAEGVQSSRSRTSGIARIAPAVLVEEVGELSADARLSSLTVE